MICKKEGYGNSKGVLLGQLGGGECTVDIMSRSDRHHTSTPHKCETLSHR